MGRIGVCSWSLAARNPAELAQAAAACGVEGVQIALDPIRQGAHETAEIAGRLRDAGLRLLSGMMATAGEDYSTLDSIRRTGGLRPDEHWPANLDAARNNAQIAADLELALVTMHAGFMPEGESDSQRAERALLLDRLAEIARIFENHGVRLGLETGQETAHTLLEALSSPGLDKVGVNFDPGNMILYGMGDPAEALRALAGRIVQLHIKDALPAQRPGEWGAEVAVGAGAVNWPALFATLKEAKLDVDLVIEREAGQNRIGDVQTARALIEDILRKESP